MASIFMCPFVEENLARNERGFLTFGASIVTVVFGYTAEFIQGLYKWISQKVQRKPTTHQKFVHKLFSRRR
jgi:hypothetical protein